MFKKNDPLVESVKKIMEHNELRRRVEARLCEELGIASRKALPFEHQANYDALFEQRIQEALHPNQQKLDVHEPEKDKLTAQDFKMLRAGKKASMKEEDKSSSDPDMAAPADPRAPKYKDEIKYKDDSKSTMPKNPPMPPRRPANLEEKASPEQQDKVAKVMREFKKRKLHSGSKKGPTVTDRKQAIAIALNQAGLSKKDSEND